MIRYRRAEIGDLDQLLDLIEAGFTFREDGSMDSGYGREHRILFSYLYNEKINLKRLYLAEKDGDLVAAAGVFPQVLSFEEAHIPVWAISPVVTHPKHRNQGLAVTCLATMFEELVNQGIPAVFLWGLPDYYPRFGFVPVLPRYKTKLKGPFPKISGQNGCFRLVQGVSDIEIIASLYNYRCYERWLQPERSLDWWRKRFNEMDIEDGEFKEVPFPRKDRFLVWENDAGEVGGYLYYQRESSVDRIYISEAAAIDLKKAQSMLSAFIDQEDSFREINAIYIRGTPEHLLNGAAYRCNGIHMCPAPLAGMVKVLNWPDFVTRLNPILIKRMKSSSFSESCWCLEKFGIEYDVSEIRMNWEKSMLNVTLSANPVNTQLTRLIFGIYDLWDLNDISRDQKSLVKTLFPQRFPFIWDNNYLY